MNKRQEIKDYLEAKKEIDKFNYKIFEMKNEMALKEKQKEGLESLDVLKELVLKYGSVENFEKIYREKEKEVDQVNNILKILVLKNEINQSVQKNLEYNREIELLKSELTLIKNKKEEVDSNLKNYNIRAAEEKNRSVK